MEKSTIHKIIGGVAAGIILIVGCILAFICIERIPAGYVGVVYNMNGGIEGDTLGQGWHMVAPTKHITLYSIGMEQSYLTADKRGDSRDDESFKVPTSDGKSVLVELEFSYRFDPDRVPETFKIFKGKSGEDLRDSFIKPKVIAWAQEISANHPVTDIFGDKRTQINREVEAHLKERFNKYGIIIDAVNFTNISVDAETEKAIQKKVNAQQELELANIEAQTAKVQAEKDKAVAEINAQKNILEAEARAEVIRITAEAEAESNKKIAESLTSNLIDKIKYDKWDGQLPKVSSNGSSILNIKDF